MACLWFQRISALSLWQKVDSHVAGVNKLRALDRDAQVAGRETEIEIDREIEIERQRDREIGR